MMHPLLSLVRTRLMAFISGASTGVNDSNEIKRWLQISLVLGVMGSCFPLGMHGAERAVEKWPGMQPWVQNIRIQNDKFYILKRYAIQANDLSSEVDPGTDPSAGMLQFQALAESDLLPNEELSPHSARFLFRLPNFVYFIYSSWIYPDHAVFEIGQHRKPTYLIAFPLQSEESDKPTKFNVTPDPEVRSIQMVFVTDSKSEVFVHNEKECFLIDFLTGQVTERWAGVPAIEIGTYRHPTFCKKTGTLTRAINANETAYVYQHFVKETEKIRRERITEFKSPDDGNVFINPVLGDPEGTEFIWAINQAPMVCHYCQLNKNGVLDQRVMKGLTTEDQTDVALRGVLVRKDQKIYGYAEDATARRMIWNVPAKE